MPRKILTVAGKRIRSPQHVTLQMPPKAWTILRETLEVDARSSVVDPALREEIRQALAAVKEVIS